MMVGEIIALIATIAVVYVILLVAYVATCLTMSHLNGRLPGAKIQERVTTPELVRRDRRQSLVSLAGIAAMFGTGHWAYAELGWGWTAPTGTIAPILSALASLILFDTWFYWLHRLIHTRRLYRTVHQWHHMTVTPVVWSNNSDRLIDNLFLQSYWLVAHLILPISPAVLLVHKIYDQVTGIIGHSGWEHGGRWCWPPSPLVAVTHHDQHHRFFQCNYATHFTLWDRLMGTLHPEHDAELKSNIARTESARSEATLRAE